MKISIRYQILGLLTGLLLFVIVAYLLLATRLFTQDKLAYIYDLERSLTTTLSQEVRASIGSLVDKLGYFAEEQARGNASRAASSLLSTDPDLLSIEIWERQEAGGFTRVFRYADPVRLASMNLTEQDLAESRRLAPVPIEVVATEGPILQNASMPPDIAILSLAAPVAGGRRVAVSTMRPDRLLRIFGHSDAYRVYLVDGKGVIVVHPDPVHVIRRENVATVPIVQESIRGGLARVHEFDAAGGSIIGAFAPVGLGRLSVVAEVPREEAERASHQLVWRSILFGLGILFLGLIASIYFARRLTAPLRQLEEATQMVASGEFSNGVTVKSRNEIGRLATAFNKMGEELADREARLSEVHGQLVESAKLSVLGELSASMAHEVKNPLSGIIGYAQFGLTLPTLEQAREHLQLIERHAWRASEIIETLLDFARHASVEFRELDACAITAEAVRLVRYQLHAKRVLLETDLVSGVPPIRGNANQLQQVILNLIMNAVQAMEGQPERMLRVSVAATNGAVEITIRDTGVGMTPEVKKRIFAPFFTTKPRGKGTGLGLSVSQRIVGQHGGEIRFESEPGRGSSFVVRIPTALALKAETPTQASG